MDKLSFMGKLLNAVDVAIQAHKDAQTQSEYLYIQGKLDAFKKVVEWLKECE